MQHRPTAILSADVVGYSGLMEADETGTLEPVFDKFARGLGAMSWLKIVPDLDGLREHPRFKAIMAAAAARPATH